MTPPDWAKLNIPPIDYQDAYYYAAPKARKKLESLDEVDPEILKVYEKLGIPIEEQKVLAGVEGARKVAVDAVFDSVSVATTFRAELESGRDLPLDFGSDPRISRSGPKMAGQGRADARQLFRDIELRGLFGRHLRLHPRGRALPDGAFDLFPHQRRKYRPVRTHFDRRRQGRLCQLSRRLHRADARRKPAPRRGGRTGRAGRCRDQIFARCRTGIPAMRKGKGGIYNFVTKRALCQGATARSAGRRSKPAARSPGNIRAAS
jgi:Fe-S cluster assembly protein SufB